MAYRRRMVNLESNLLGTSKTSGGAGGGTKDHDAAGGGQPPLADDAAAPGAAVPAITEDVLDVLLRALCHGDTIVRWSAAKGVGRICERLPRAAADDVVTAILGIFDELDNDSGWHGACLALAELCRRWALMPERFGEVVPLVAKALRFDVSRGSYTVGSHVRDAACYVCWSIARAYNTEDVQAYVPQLGVALVLTACMDREVNVRRAASAAFQECVGRLGTLPDGIALVQLLDFFALSTLKQAMLVVTPQVARFTAYCLPILNHLVDSRLVHGDKALRSLAASALGLIVQENGDGGETTEEVDAAMGDATPGDEGGEAGEQRQGTSGLVADDGDRPPAAPRPTEGARGSA